MECQLELNQERCNCTYPCDMKGKCCQCILYHRERGELPACLFPPEVERTYDRSFGRFVEIYLKKKRGG